MSHPFWVSLVDGTNSFIDWLTEYPEPFDPDGLRQRLVLFGMLIGFVWMCAAWTILTAKDKRKRHAKSSL